MFSFPFCWSIAIHVLLVIVFGITEFSLPGNSFPSNETCVNVSSEIVCLFKGSEEPMAWNEAWQLCSSFSATLPVIRNRDEQNALAGFLESREGNTDAWTAGRKDEGSRWTWIKGGPLEKFDEVESYDEIKYTNWDENIFSKEGECISICTSDGKWKARGCREHLAGVCQKVLLKEGTTDGSRSSIPQSSAAAEESITHGSPGSALQNLTFLALVAAIIIIICLVAFVLKTKNGSVIEMCNSMSNNNPTRNNRGRLYSSATNANVNRPTSVHEYEYVTGIHVVAPVERSVDVLDDYAEISSLSLNQSEDGATEQQPGIDETSLACGKEPVNLEPEKKRDHRNTSTKIGPLGDTYAIPVAKGHGDRHTSPVGYNSHPIKVTAQGDVYALPMKRSKSSTSNNPGEVVYVNLPTEMLGKEEAPETHVQTK